ncbi:hypothetical protein MPLB_1700139 [Mesorhizobium sp. ORS 3324]|nr:hypothetical protein MPLB_1700139 [Mesorhizobium sp. ORS 3324]
MVASALRSVHGNFCSKDGRVCAIPTAGMKFPEIGAGQGGVSGVTAASRVAISRAFMTPTGAAAPTLSIEGRVRSLFYARPAARTSLRGNPRAHAAQSCRRPEEDGHRLSGRGGSDL